MSDTPSDVQEQGTEAAVETSSDAAANFAERYSDVLGKVNNALDQVDWDQMGKLGKATGIVVAVCVVQILIKGVLDTINVMPILPGLLELLGLVVVGQWSWQNLTTSDKRNAVVENLQNLRKEYLG
jgi:hypothetical protein